jgi:hypothetical protein
MATAARTDETRNTTAACAAASTCALDRVVCCALRAACCALHAARCVLHVACCILRVACCALCVALHVAMRSQRAPPPAAERAGERASLGEATVCVLRSNDSALTCSAQRAHCRPPFRPRSCRSSARSLRTRQSARCNIVQDATCTMQRSARCNILRMPYDVEHTCIGKAPRTALT